MNSHNLDCIGSMVDEAFLAPGRLIAYLQARRTMDWQAYAREIAFYHEQGYAKHPQSFFAPPASMPVYQIETQVPFQEGTYQVIAFPSGFEPRNPFIRDRFMAHAANRTGYLIRWTHGDKVRKTVLCVHGFMMGAPREAYRMFKIGKLFHLGLDVALFIHPFHWRRIEGPRAARRIYLTLGDAAFTNECIAQSVYDLDTSFMILNDLGAVDIGMVGASLGGYITGLYAGLRPTPRFAALMVPAFSFLTPIGPERMLDRAPFDGRWRTSVLQAADFHSPLNLTPQIPRDHILVVASRGDRICPFGLVEDFCRRWSLNRCYFRTGGHWLVFDNLRGRSWYSFLNDMGFIPIAD